MKVDQTQINKWKEKGLSVVDRGNGSITVDAETAKHLMASPYCAQIKKPRRAKKLIIHRPPPVDYPIYRDAECKYTILGNVPSKSNSYRIGKNCLYKTRQVIMYECSFIAQCPELNRNIQGEFELHMDVYYDSRRPDIDGSLKVVLDCLQKSKVIKNDNKCIHLNIRKHLDKKNPRVEYKITEVAKA